MLQGVFGEDRSTARHLVVTSVRAMEILAVVKSLINLMEQSSSLEANSFFFCGTRIFIGVFTIPYPSDMNPLHPHTATSFMMHF
jgi:hypothetical protein